MTKKLTATAREIARAKLRAQLMERGGTGELRDLQAVLCEDNRTVMIFAEWNSDDPAWTYVEHRRWCSHATFDATKFLAWFCRGVGH
jgi:hypothetical protein